MYRVLTCEPVHSIIQSLACEGITSTEQKKSDVSKVTSGLHLIFLCLLLLSERGEGRESSLKIIPFQSFQLPFCRWQQHVATESNSANPRTVITFV